MKVYARYHNAAHLTAALGILSYSAAAGAPGLAVVTTALVVTSWALFRRTTHSPLPRIVINIALLLATLQMVPRVLGDTSEALTVLSEYLVILLLIKLFENRTPRDQAQSLILSAMVGVGAVLTSIGPLVGVLLALYLPMLLVTGVRYQLYAGTHASFARFDKPSDRPIGRVGTAGRRTSLRFAVVMTFMFVTTIAGAGGVFIFMPRINEAPSDPGADRSRGDEASSVTGFQDHIQLGTGGSIRESREIVGYVEIERNGRPVTAGIPRYFRGVTLDEYNSNNGTWRRGPALERLDAGRRLAFDGGQGNPDVYDRGARELPPLYDPDRPGEPYPAGMGEIVQRFTLVNKRSDTLFSLAMPIQVSYPRRNPIKVNPIDGKITLEGVSGEMTYQVRSAPDYQRALTPEQLERYLDSELSTRVFPFAGGVVGDPVLAVAREVMDQVGIQRERPANTRLLRTEPQPRDAELVRAFAAHLASRCQYSTDLALPDEFVDPTVYFLNFSQQGACEYFASALAGMCRAVGIPARVVTGYLTNEFEEATGAYVIRQSHAHAWVEARVLDDVIVIDPETGESRRETRALWRTFDASPSEGVQQQLAGRGFASRVREWMTRFENMWVDSVVQFDARDQKRLFGSSGIDAISGLDSRLDGLAERLGFEQRPDDSALGVILRGVMVPAGLGVLGVGLIVFAWRRHAAPVKRGRSRASELARRFDRAVARAGCDRPGHAGLLEHARTMPEPHRSAAIEAASAVYRVRYAGEESSSGAEGEALASIDRLRGLGPAGTVGGDGARPR